MAQPITWRTIAGPNFNNSAMGHAINAFRLSGEGFSRFGDELITAQERADKQATNRSIFDTLQTGRVDPNLDARADSARVYDALLGKQKAESDLEIAESQRANIASQIGLRDEQTKDARYKNSDEWRALKKRATESAIAADEAVNSYNTWKLKVGKRDDAEAQRFKAESRDLDGKLVEIRQGAYQEYLSQNVAPGATPTLEQEQEARMYADSAARDPAARQILEQYAQERGYLPESWDLSKWGEYDALNDQTLASLAEKRAERAEILAEAETNRTISEGQGYLGNTIIRNGQRVAYTDDMAEVERMTSYKEAVGKLRLQGINVDMLDGKKASDIEHQVIEAARQVLPNASLLAPAIEPFIKNGEFDAEGFRKNVLNKVGPLTIQDRINLSRTEAGLPPVDMGIQSGGGGNVSAQDVLGDTKSLAERGGLLSPENLRRLWNTEPFGSKQGRQLGEWVRKQLIGNEAGQPILDLSPYVNPFPPQDDNK